MEHDTPSTGRSTDRFYTVREPHSGQEDSVRIISGVAKGRRLAVPPGRSVRPTADRVREALFSALGDVAVVSLVLDLFAGSGALGLEALSRGAAQAVFVERSHRAFTVLTRNVATAGFEPQARVIRGDFATTIDLLSRESALFDLVFLDPPYRSGLLNDALERLVFRHLLVPGARVITEHPPDNGPAEIPGLRISGARSYGDTSLTFLVAPGKESSRQTKES